MTTVEIILIVICLILLWLVLHFKTLNKKDSMVAERALKAYGKTTAYYYIRCGMLEGAFENSFTATMDDLETAFALIKNQDPAFFTIINKQYNEDLEDIIKLTNEVQWQRIATKHGINE